MLARQLEGVAFACQWRAMVLWDCKPVVTTKLARRPAWEEPTDLAMWPTWEVVASRFTLSM